MLKGLTCFLTTFFAVLNVLCWHASNAEAATLLYSNQFDNSLGDIQEQMGCYSYTYTLVSSPPPRSGSKAVKHFMEGSKGCLEFDGKTIKHRAMLRHGQAQNLLFAAKQPYWIGFSFYVPQDYPNNNWETAAFIWGLMSGNGPPGEHAALIVGSNLNIMRRYNDGQLKEFTEASIPLTKGKWMDVIINIVRDWEPKGTLKVWINGQQIINDVNQVTATNYQALNALDPAFRTGIYWGEVNRTENYTIYFDNIRVAQGTNGYDLVTPTGSSAPTISNPPATPTRVQVTKN